MPLVSGVKAVLFDVDGTLADTIPMILAGLGDAFEHFTGTRPLETTLRGMIGMPLRDQMNLLGMDTHPTSVKERVAFAMQCYANHGDLVREFPEAMRALESVPTPTALVTSRNAAEAEWITSLLPKLATATVLVSADDVLHAKPEPDAAVCACTRLGVLPQETLFVGDSLHDMGCAKAAGCITVAVSYGAASAETLATAEPNFIFRTPAELETWLQETLENPSWQTNRIPTTSSR